MLDFMVDLETLGDKPGCAILSIGAVAFDPVEQTIDGGGFYKVVSRASCKKAKLGEDRSTIDWWERQSEAARQVLADSLAKNATPLKDALIELNVYLTSFGPAKKIRVWGNGADFDNAILCLCYQAAGVQMPWDFWNNRCFRTLKNLAPQVKVDRSGTYHNALDDARTQADHALKIFALMGNRMNLSNGATA
jgi:exodeoxyribonuclease VIII